MFFSSGVAIEGGRQIVVKATTILAGEKLPQILEQTYFGVVYVKVSS